MDRYGEKAGRTAILRSDPNRRCIDGSIHGCGVCRGYCSFHEHPGYLTDRLMADHQCLEKGCHYFIKKAKRERIRKEPDRADEVVSAAQREAEGLEGMKVLRAEQSETGSWTVYYVAIAEYMLRDIEERMSRSRGERICFSKLNHTFDNAVRVIMG